VDITDNLKGSDELLLEVVLTRMNTFGPLHHKPNGRKSFLPEEKNFTMNYVLHPSGILENPRLLLY